MSTEKAPSSGVRSIDELDKAICAHAAHINAATYRFLMLVREFDERGGFLRWSFHSCAEWLHWRCDLSHQASRERVRVAHALKSLPAISRAFECGALSYSKVRALTRVAGPKNEVELLEFALRTTAARLEERVRQMRNGEEGSAASAASTHANRSLIITRNERSGTFRLTVELPLEEGELIQKALDKALNASEGGGAEFASEPLTALQVDALVEIARDYLSGAGTTESGPSASVSAAEQYQVLVHVDEKALAGVSGRSDLPVETVRRLSCDGSVVTLRVDGDGEPLSIGRKQRTIPPAIRRALHARDRHCSFPGCTHARFVDGHHIVHWSQGGETSLDNLVLLCWRHHRLLHEGGYTMHRDQHGQWYFRRADGRGVPPSGYRYEDMKDDDVGDDGSEALSCGDTAGECDETVHLSAAASSSLSCGASAEARDEVREAGLSYSAEAAVAVAPGPGYRRVHHGAGSGASGRKPNLDGTGRGIPPALDGVWPYR